MKLMKDSAVLIISPSGNLYGSENVLLDYLNGTGWRHTVAVPVGTKLEQKLRGGRHHVVTFNRLTIFYALLFIKLVFGRFHKVYVNEGGHLRYISILAKFFPKKEFLMHVRIIEDAAPSRWQGYREANMKVLVISNYLQDMMPVPSILIYDPFVFRDNIQVRKIRSEDLPIKTAVVGRISVSKGVYKLVELAQAIVDRGLQEGIVINIFGEITEDVDRSVIDYLQSLDFVKFHGFVPSAMIYTDVSVVIHLNKTEPLGRIFFEALSAGLPIIGYKSGGIGEVGALLGLNNFLIPPGDGEISRFLDKIQELPGVDTDICINEAISAARVIFSREKYVMNLDALLDHER